MNDDDEWLDTEEFLARLEFMPDYEAYEALILRKQRRYERGIKTQSLRAKFLREQGKNSPAAAELGQQLYLMSMEAAQVNVAIDLLVKRQEEVSWHNAIQAVYGEEGLFLTKKWKIENDPRRPTQEQYGPGLRKLMDRYALVVPQLIAESG